MVIFRLMRAPVFQMGLTKLTFGLSEGLVPNDRTPGAAKINTESDKTLLDPLMSRVQCVTKMFYKWVSK